MDRAHRQSSSWCGGRQHASNPKFPLTSPHTHIPWTQTRLHTHTQVLTLHNLREFDASGGGGPHASYTPRDPEILELLSRDPRGDDKHPFQAAMDDCLMITIKGIAAGMQNTG